MAYWTCGWPLASSGINRLTRNFELALPIIDDAFRYVRGSILQYLAMAYDGHSGCSVSDEEAVAMSRYLVHHDGLFLGSSSACNLVACIRLVKKMKWHTNEKIVTILRVSVLSENVGFAE